MADTPPLNESGEGLTIAVRVTPKASSNKVAGIESTADGKRALKVKVTAPPEDGKANAAVIKVLAKTWKLPKSALDIISGAANRNKVLRITCDVDAQKRVKAWFRSQEEKNEQG